jgi:hypothetical protein
VIDGHSTTILKDDSLARQMVEDGYIVLPFLDEEELREFQQLYERWHSTSPKAFFKSYFDPRLEYKKNVEEKVVEHFEKKTKHYILNYDAFGGMFVFKPPTTKGHIPSHQDWCFVDETKYWSMNMWCPLQDVNDDNGSLMVLKESHRLIETFRGSRTADVYQEHRELIENNMIPIPLKAGEALFFFNVLLHRSKLNHTADDRVCLGLTLTLINAPFYFYYMTNTIEEERLEYFETTPEFYIHYTADCSFRRDIPGEIIPYTCPVLAKDNEYAHVVNSKSAYFLRFNQIKRSKQNLGGEKLKKMTNYVGV